MLNRYIYKHPHPAVTTDCVVLAPHEGELNVLLIERAQEPFKGCWAFPGGFLNIDEDAAAGCRRELKEETGIEVGQMMQVGAYTKPDRDPRERVITIAYVAYLEKPVPVQGGDDASHARWFPLSKLPNLAFDHAQILHDVQELVNI